MKITMLSYFVLMSLMFSFSNLTFGQPSEPYWDTTIGNPGVSAQNQYIGALERFDDGFSEMLYAGGSFSNVAGLLGTSLIARWDPLSQTWSGVGGGFSDGFVNSIVVFDSGVSSELVVGGVFLGPTGVPNSNNIVKWDGNEWSSLGTGIPNDGVWAMTTWDGMGSNRLYVGGRFTTAGGVVANDIASWDGVEWRSMGTGVDGSYQPYVDHMLAWDDGSGEKLYVGGRFDSIDGVNSPLLARWDGQSWEQVGNGLISANYLFGIESMAVFDDGSGPALFVGGYQFHAPGQPVGNISKWDGQEWTTVGPLHDGRVTELCVFDDGSGPSIYRTGNAAYDLLYFARLVDNDWETVGGGVWSDPAPPWPSTYAMCVWDDRLYLGGTYNLAGGEFPSGCIAAWVRPETDPDPIDITLTADQPLQVSRGSNFTYDVLLESHLPSIQYVDIWTGVNLPNGNHYGPIWRINDFPMGPGFVIEASGIYQEIPVFAPLGTYTFVLRAGIFSGFVAGEDEFTFEVIAQNGAHSGDAREWQGVGFEEAFSPVASSIDDIMIPEAFRVSSFYPNPFNASTSLSVSLPEATDLSVLVFDVLGREVAMLTSGRYSAGEHRLTFNATDLASGLYFIRATVPGHLDQVQKVMLVR